MPLFSDRPSHHLLLLLVFAVLVTLPGLTTMPPLDRDETRFAQASTQMLESGDFVTIRFQQEERNKKPAGIYWLQAASVHNLSSVEARAIWAYRVPSMLGAIFAILLTWRLGLLLFSSNTALWGAMLLGAAPALMGEATIAKTDAMLLASVCASQLGFAKLFLAGIGEITLDPLKRWLWVLVIWLGLGVGVLLKGPIAPLIFLTTMIGLFFWPGAQDRVVTARQWFKAIRPLSGILIVLVLFLPWAIAVGTATQGRFFAEAIGMDMLGKVGRVQESHAGPPGYHLLLLPILFWSASAILPAAGMVAYRQKMSGAVWFLIAWIAPAWLIFELTATKLPHYVLPVYPAIALLCAHTVLRLSRNSCDLPSWIFKLGGGVFTIIGCGIVIALYALTLFYRTYPIGLGDVAVFMIVGLASLLVGNLFWRRYLLQGVAGSVFLSAAICALLLNTILPSLDRLDIAPALSKALVVLDLHPVQSEGVPATTIVGYSEPSAVFLLGSNTKLTTSLDVALYNLADHDKATAIIEARVEDEFLNAARKQSFSVIPLATVDGFNYSNGDDIQLTIYGRKIEQ